MRISRPSSKALAALSLAIASTAPAQQEPAPPPGKPGARAAISAEGQAAMERLKTTRQQRSSPPSTNGPALPPPTDSAAARRAVDGYRRRSPSPSVDTRARAALQAGEARLAADREAMASRLRQALGLEAPEMAAIAKARPAPATKAWAPLLFVSSSMPMPVLRTYARQLERVKGVLAFRGMPGGLTKVGPMAKLSAEILRIDSGCSGPACAMRDVQVIIDPIVFRQHGVLRVPALAMIPGDPTQPYCERDEQSPRASHLVYGDSALTGLLEEYARLGGKEEVRDAQALAAR